MDKPFDALCEFARALDWSPLKIHHHSFPSDAADAETHIVTWYEAGDSAGKRSDLFLQINEHPIGALRSYTAAVYAIRFSICTGWHCFRLTSALTFDASEAARLDLWLHHRWFRAPAARREFRVLHPECVGYSWKRIRRDGPPHLPMEK